MYRYAWDTAKLPKFFGTTLDWDWTADTRDTSSKNVTSVPESPREIWSEGCYAEVSIPVEALRSRSGDTPKDAVNPWNGQTLSSALLTAIGSSEGEETDEKAKRRRVVDVPVKVIVQNRAAWATAFYVGRLTLVGLYRLNSVYLYLESAWFQPLHL